MATVQNVIFDLGGVLLDWNPSGILERCSPTARTSLTPVR